MNGTPSLTDGEPVLAAIGLGANLGDTAATLRAAIVAIGRLPASRLVGSSSLYQTDPIDAAGPLFVNAVVLLSTRLQPVDLLRRLHAIEAGHRRERPYRNAPRTLDLDLLTYGDTIMHSDVLTLPHPRMHLRAFVLIPLLEVAPEIRIPGLGLASALLSAVADQTVTRLPT